MEGRGGDGRPTEPQVALVGVRAELQDVVRGAAPRGAGPPPGPVWVIDSDTGASARDVMRSKMTLSERYALDEKERDASKEKLLASKGESLSVDGLHPVDARFCVLGRCRLTRCLRLSACAAEASCIMLCAV